jgi:saccharopine dehydrogenase (NAD+, L-glutamate forming)
MLTEAALCLAEDADRMSVCGGFWTPAAAMGKLLRDRITAHAGLTFVLS